MIKTREEWLQAAVALLTPTIEAVRREEEADES